MPTAIECVSCCEIDQVANMMRYFDLFQCITDHESFEHVCVLLCGFYKLTTSGVGRCFHLRELKKL